MALTFDFYQDAGLTVLLDDFAGWVEADDGSTSPQDKQVWLGSPVANRVAKTQTNPGVDHILASLADLNAGMGEPVSAFRLALTQGGLATATPGAPLDLGVTQILSGTANAKTFWIRVTDQTGVAGDYADISLLASPLRDDPV